MMAELSKLEAAPLYEYVCKELKWPVDAKLMASLKEKNKESLESMDSAISDAKENLGESEVRESLLKKAEYLAQIGDKDACIEAVRQTTEKTVGLGNRMDLVFLNIRVGLFFTDHTIIKANIAKAHQMLEEGGDWDRRNRLKVYEGLYMMSIRDFAAGSKLFLDGVSTFTSYELTTYIKFVEYTVIISVLALDRSDLHKEVIKGSEILEVLHQLPNTKNYLFSLYNCQYADFFQVCSILFFSLNILREFFQELGKVEQLMKADRYLFPHYKYYVREVKIKAYAQLLESYSSLTLGYMAQAFGVTEKYIDEELSKFIAGGRLHAKIDKVTFFK